MIFVATPLMDGRACVNYVTSVIRLKDACSQVGVPVTFYFHSGESCVSRARNECAARFEASIASHLFWIDGDVGFEPEDVLRLYGSGLDMVAGTYPLKCDELRFPVDFDALGPVDERGFARAEMLTTGFMCVSRKVLDTIREGMDLQYFTDEGHERTAYFMGEIVDREYRTEDYRFSRLWTSLGGEAYLDTQSRFTHQGRKLYAGAVSELM